MDIGTGIAIAGVWLFAGAAFFSKGVSATGMWLALFVAIGITIFLS